MGKPPTFSITFVLLSLSTASVFCKECTNVFPGDYGTKAFRHLLQTSKNETWKREVYSEAEKKMNPTGDNTKASSHSMISRRMMRHHHDHTSLEKLHKQIKFYQGAENLQDSFLKEVPLHSVSLDPDSMYGTAQQTNLEYLLMLDTDNLLWSFRKTAGFDTPGHPYSGWEASDCELRGHFVGHFLSSSAKLWASTKNETLRRKMMKVVEILDEVQTAMGTGYLSAFPSEELDRFENLTTVWAPYYTIHKIMAGLLDQYTFVGSERSLIMLKKMVDYHYDRVIHTIKKYSIQRQWNCLNEEVGGMNDVLYRLYGVTGDKKHLVLAHFFDKPCFLGELAIQANDISSYHANTHIPLVTGAQMRYEVTGDPLYRDLSTYFVHMVNSSHTYATGGTSENEHFTDPSRLATSLTTENEESCTTYNMLKLIRNLFRWTRDPKYADYYERALINGVLPIQRGTEPGVMIYLLPLKAGASKANSSRGWGQPFSVFWCCYGTATESFAKLGDTIYFEEAGKTPGLYVAQYIPNTFRWSSGEVNVGMTVRPVSSWSDTVGVQITLDPGSKSTPESTLHLRVPVWTEPRQVKAVLNDKPLQVANNTGNYLTITRKWSPGDQINLDFPITLRIEPISDDRLEYASLHAIMYGPFLLAGLSKGDNDIKVAPNSQLTDWITPVTQSHHLNLVSLTVAGNQMLSLAATPESLRLLSSPIPGTNEAADSTFRLIFKDNNTSTQADAIGKSIMFELYGYPGMVLAHRAGNNKLQVVPRSSDDDESSSVFQAVSGLDGAAGTISFESANKQGCYIVIQDSNVSLGCKGSLDDLNNAASFKMDKGNSEYHPISFIAKGTERSFLLLPLLSFRDEQYTVYFNILDGDQCS